MSIKRILLTGGRAPVTLELARLFRQAGCVVFVAESIPFHCCRFSRSVEKSYLVAPPRQNTRQFITDILEIIEKEKIDLLLPTCEEIFYIAQAHEELSLTCQVFSWPINKLNQLHHKGLFIRLAEELGFKVPKTLQCGSREELQRIIDEWNDNSHFVLKPVYSRFGTKVKIISSKKTPVNVKSVSQENPWLVQEFIEGDAFCTYSVVKEGKVVAHTVYKSEYRAGDGAAITFSHVNHPGIEKWVTLFAELTTFTGQLSFDFIETNNGDLFSIECNPRATSGIHNFAQQPEFIQAFLTSGVEVFYPKKARSMLSFAMILFALPRAVSGSSLKEWLSTFWQSKDVFFRWSDPLPFIHQVTSLIHFFLVSKRQKISILEATTWDIEWNGER